MKIVCYEGYLTIDLVDGVAPYSPGEPISVSNSVLQFGQVVFILFFPSPFILL
jgi:hypothetical protein